MANPAPRQRLPADLVAPDDPRVDLTDSIERAYQLNRARRRARIEHRRHTRLAHMRFWIVLAVLFGICVFVVLVVWHEIQRLFGL